MATPPPNLSQKYLNADKGPGIRAGNAVVGILAIMAVVLRVVSRRVKGLGLGADDWLMVIALPFGMAMAAITIAATYYGLGKHLYAVPPEKLMIEGQLFLSTEIIWASSIPFIKCSILILYVRIFGTLHYLRWAAYILGVFSICWAIMVVLVLAFQCRPLAAVWDPTVHGQCINAPVFFIAGSAPNVFTDFVILALPMHAVWTLQTSRTQKTLLTGIFALGSLTCVISLVRFVALVQNATQDVTWALGIVSVWSTAEPCLGIVSASLPTMRPILQPFFNRLNSNKRSDHSSLVHYAQSRPSKPVSNPSKGWLDAKNGQIGYSESLEGLRGPDNGAHFYEISSPKAVGMETDITRAEGPSSSGEADIYALTTIDVESHPEGRRNWGSDHR